MKISDVFWNAAQEIRVSPSEFKSYGCCDAILCGASNGVSRVVIVDAQEWFTRMFQPPNSKCFWWACNGYADQDARRLALLFAHYIAKSEGL